VLKKSFTSPVIDGLGIDCPDIRQIIHLGPPEHVEAYLQATEDEMASLP
jgi:hypothetical protein